MAFCNLPHYLIQINVVKHGECAAIISLIHSENICGVPTMCTIQQLLLCVM